MTIDVTDQFVVHTGQSFTFTDEDGFMLDGDTGPALINKGQITVHSVEGVDGRGAFAVGSDVHDAFLWNRAGASIEVDDDSASGHTTGINLQGLDNHLRNDGEITVSGTTTWAVMAQLQGFRFDNTGLFDVRGSEGALALFVGSSAHVDNSGTILVRGPGAQGWFNFHAGDGSGELVNTGLFKVVGAQNALGIDLTFGMDDFHLDNAGRFIVRATGAEGGSIGLHVDLSGASVTIDNSGVFSATTAISQVGYDDQFEHSRLAINNSGKIVGDIDLAGETAAIVNTGLIRGDVDLGYGDDVFNGAGGRLDGSLMGGIGADTLTGGLGADSFRYGELADSTLVSADLIKGLQAIDTIDLSRIDADPSTDGQQHLTAGQVTLTFDTASGNTWLDVDTGGEAGPEMRIVISGDHTDFTGIVL